MWDNGDVVRDFVPAIYNGATGLWDRENGVFYPNKGAGAYTGASGIGAVDPEDDMVAIVSTAPDMPASQASLGLQAGFDAGDEETFSAPTFYTNAAGTVALACIGWKLYDAEGTVLDSGNTASVNYVHPTPAVYRKLEWLAGTEYYAALSAGTGGSVSQSSQWIAKGAAVSFSAIPDSGFAFVKWTGDLPAGVSAFDPSPSFTMSGPFSMQAEFTPAPDTLLEYVESTNVTTYIDTGIIPSAANTRFVAKIAPTLVNNTEAAPFGVRSSTSNADNDAVYIRLVSSKINADWCGKNASGWNSQFTPVANQPYVFDFIGNHGFIDNRVYTGSSGKGTAVTHTFYLFAMNSNGTLKNGMKQRFYGARIYTNSNILAANYIPCLKNGVAGLYDSVSGRTLLPQNFPLVASAEPNASYRFNGNALETRLSVTGGEGGAVAQTGERWVAVGAPVSLSATPNAGYQTLWTSDHAGKHFADATTGNALAFAMPPHPVTVSATFTDAPEVPFVTDLNPIITATPAGGTVQLGEGTYRLTTQALLNKAVTVKGAGVDRTVVTAPYGSLARAFNLSNADATLCNLTVAGCTNFQTGAAIYMTAGTVSNVRVTANSTGLNCYATARNGGGIYLTGGTVTNCVVSNNRTFTGYGFSYGSGVGMEGGTIVDSTISGNGRTRSQSRGCGLYILGSGSPRVIRCRIVGNDSGKQGLTATDTRGMGIWMENDKAIVERCEIVSNQHHAVYMTKGTLRNCLIWGHTGTSSSASLTPGVQMSGGSLYNNTISANDSPANNPGLYMTAGTAVNNIIYGNTGGAYGASVSGGTFNTNIVSDTAYVTTSAAVGNSTGDPLMADSVNGDFTIGFSSPAVDAGAAIASVTEDFAGVERPQDGNGDGTAAPDIGAYEYVPAEGEAMDAAIVLPDADFRYDGTITATARVSGGSGDYTYEWYLDGALVPDQTTAEFSATGLSTGNHTLRLVVSDGETTVTNDYAGSIVFHPVEVYVSSSGSATFPYDTPETATDAPSDAFAALWLASDTTCTVHVAEGTYYLSTPLSLSKPCRVLGAGRDATVLCGARMGSAYRAITMTDADSIVRDLTVTGCTNNLTGASIYMSRGWLENVKSTLNKDYANGGQVSSGAGLCIAGGTATNCIVTGNAQESSWGNSHGAGVYITAGLLVDSEVSDNWRNRYQTYGAGVYATGGTVRRCRIHGNSNKSGGSGETAGMGVELDGSGAVVENCLIQDNGRQGVFLKSGTLRNCLVTGHKTAGSAYAGGVYMEGGKLHNCTVADNKCGTAAYDDLRMTAGTAANTIAVVATVAGGTTNSCLLNADAGFKRAATGNYRLALGSPAIDIGDNAIWSAIADAVDLDGNRRIIPRRNGIVDAGCYEFQPPAGTVLFLQ